VPAPARYPRSTRAEALKYGPATSFVNQAQSGIRLFAEWCRILPDSGIWAAHFVRVLSVQHQWRLFASRDAGIRAAFLPAGLPAPARQSRAIRAEVPEDGPPKLPLRLTKPGIAHCAEFGQLKLIAAGSTAPNVTKSILKLNMDFIFGYFGPHYGHRDRARLLRQDRHCGRGV